MDWKGGEVGDKMERKRQRCLGGREKGLGQGGKIKMLTDTMVHKYVNEF